MSNVVFIDSFRITTSDDFFFDNNIWMYLYCPIGGYASKKQEKYGNLLQQILYLKRPIFLNSLVLSEFTNTWLRMEYYDWLGNQDASKYSFKNDFIGTDWYKASVAEISVAIRQIEKVTTRGTDDFNSINLDIICDGLSSRDFNDNYYLALAEKKKWNIVTDDADFFSNNTKGIKIITATKT